MIARLLPTVKVEGARNTIDYAGVATQIVGLVPVLIALTIAEVGQPIAPQTRCTYTLTFAPAPETPATPTVCPTIVPVVCVP